MSTTRAATIGPIIDLPLAAIVGGLDPALSPVEREALTKLADGRSTDRDKPISVSATTITCQASTVSIAKRSCKVMFGAHQVDLMGLKAHELAATLTEAGASSEGAAGSTHIAISNLRCRVSPLEILASAGGGAPCTFDPI